MLTTSTSRPVANRQREIALHGVRPQDVLSALENGDGPLDADETVFAAPGSGTVPGAFR